MKREGLLRVGEMSKANTRLSKSLYSLIQKPQRGLGNVPDVGCGNGAFLSGLRGAVGVELSKARARVCKSKGLSVVVADGNYLPFRSESFDTITAIEVIEHTCTPYKMLDEFHRVLSCGGEVFLSTPNLANPLHTLHQMIHRKVNKHHRLGFDPYLISQALELTGFKIERLSGVFLPRAYAFLPRICGFIPNLAHNIFVRGRKTSLQEGGE